MLAVVLAGGENSRLPITKGLINIGGKRLIETTLEKLGGLFNELAISTNEPEKYYYLGVPLIGDVHPVRGPMTGIFSVLSLYSGNYRLKEAGGQICEAFFTACDMPFIKMELAAGLAGIKQDPPVSQWDCIAPVWRGRPEPLFAFYSSRGLPEMEKRLIGGNVSLKDFLAGSRTLYMDERDVGLVDQDGRSFININTGADLEKALALADSTVYEEAP